MAWRGGAAPSRAMQCALRGRARPSGTPRACLLLLPTLPADE